MRTITFYSYKGGVGRTLLVANAAKYLCTLGKRVFALDFDLEAPGLHYKFSLDRPDPVQPCSEGLVDILFDFVREKRFPNTLAPYSTPITIPGTTDNSTRGKPDTSGSIHLLHAGAAPSAEYWKRLSFINWYDLFYGVDPTGVQFFLELKARIEDEFSPDFLLIDARTGITEMGGVATTLLPDIVVCLALGTDEHLEGTRSVVHGISQASKRISPDTPIQIISVLSRMPLTRDIASEDRELQRTKDFLNNGADETTATMPVQQMVALHSEPVLEWREQLLLGSKNSPHDVPLLRDYLRLFARIVPADEIRPHVGLLVQRATARLLDDPESAQSDLEALTTYCGDIEAFRSLLKLYRVRRISGEKVLSTASLMWQLGVPATDSLLVSVARQTTAEPSSLDPVRKHVNFIEAVWRETQYADARMGLVLAAAIQPRGDRISRLLREYVTNVESPDPGVVTKMIDLLRSSPSSSDVQELIPRIKEIAARSPEFHTIWAKAVLDRKDPTAVHDLLQDPLFQPDIVSKADPTVLYRLHKLVGVSQPELILEEALATAVSAGHLLRLRELAEIFHEEGRLTDFEARVRGRLPEPIYDEIMEYFRRPRGRRRMHEAVAF